MEITAYETLMMHYLFPGRCLLCHAHSHRTLDLCTACEADLPVLGAHCQRCALPFTPSDRANEQHCGQCLRKPPSFQRVIAPWRYQSLLARLIHRFKYRRQRSIGKLLGQLLSHHLAYAYANQPFPDQIIATPMHWLRQWQRSFNASEQLTQQLSTTMNIPMGPSVRRRFGKTQQSLDASTRKRNIKGVFKIKKRLNDLHVAIIDDVMTTGATANELSHTLIAAGAVTVDVWCLARTPAR